MDRPAKRQRLLTPLDSVYNSGFGNRHAYYETPDDELNDYEELEEEEEDEPVYDPDQELQRKRARVDFKLKSTFEAIFEKYGKDFEGIGDEIDMRTGQILVNNGHLLEMRHEMDAGDPGRRRSGQRSWEEEETDDMTSSEGEDGDIIEDQDEDEHQEDDDDDELEEDDEEDYDDEDALSDGDMMEEDDIILRGFTQASQQFLHRQRLQDPGPSKDRLTVHAEARHQAVSRPSLPGSVLPSRSEILAQFGPQLGPEIVKYVSKRGPFEENNIEPAWRVPDIVPTVTSPPARRPLIKSMVRQPEPEPERSPSPENAPSIWATTASKSGRKRFSKNDDEMLLDFVADARRHGHSLSSNLTWRHLEAMAPRHDWDAWKSRYMLKFTYLQSGPVDESDLSTSETSASTGQVHDQQPGFRLSFTQPAPPHPSRPVDAQRPVRVRKPAQRDGIVSWSEAVATIASVDPVGNAGLLDDARRTTGFSFESEHPVSSSSGVFSTRRHPQDKKMSKQPMGQYNHHRYPLGSGMRTDSLSSAEDERALSDSAFGNETNMRCPHADCRLYPTTLYRLERRPHENLSPMCSHLLDVHRIAPFPCGELNCERKGTRGYFMQKDLVRHVKEVHPYITALHRLRGRVDPALLDQSNNYERLHESIEIRRPATSGHQPRDSDFMSSQRPFSSHSLPSRRRFSLGSDHDLDKTLTPRAGARAVSDGTSSMHVHPSSATVKDMPLKVTFRERSSDSDVQILDEDPFLDRRTFKTEQVNHPDLYIEAAGGEKAGPHLPEAVRDSLSWANLKIPCTDAGCEKMLGNPGSMMTHLKMHERGSATSKVSSPTSKAPLPASIPNSQSSAGTIQSSASAIFTNGESSSAPRIFKPRVIEETFVDRSYEFSDEEDGVRPVARRPLQQPTLADQPPPMPQSFFVPYPKFKSPQSATPPKPPSTLLKKGASPKSKQPSTPAAKIRRRKSFPRDVLDSEDFDELSLGEDGFVLLSARPRTNALPKSALHVQVKQERPENRSVSAISTRKRRFSTLQADNDDEIDELGEDDPSISTLYQRGPISGSKPRPNKITQEPGLPNTRPVTAFRSRKGISNGVNPQPDSSLLVRSFQTPTKNQQFHARTNTPLIDLVKRGQPKRNEPNEPSAEIPSTSETGSSPTSRRATTQGRREAVGTSSAFTTLVSPYKKSLAGRTVKREDDGDSVVTPGGTLRKCGQNGFVCGRAFCFRCRSDEGSVV